MTPVEWRETLVLLGGFVASAFALVRLALAQQRAVTDRFVGFLEESLRRQDETVDGFREALSALNCGLRENSQILRRVAERLQVDFSDRR